MMAGTGLEVCMKQAIGIDIVYLRTLLHPMHPWLVSTFPVP